MRRACGRISSVQRAMPRATPRNCDTDRGGCHKNRWGVSHPPLPFFPVVVRVFRPRASFPNRASGEGRRLNFRAAGMKSALTIGGLGPAPRGCTSRLTSSRTRTGAAALGSRGLPTGHRQYPPVATSLTRNRHGTESVPHAAPFGAGLVAERDLHLIPCGRCATAR